jgi:ankyrin repeat protein
MALGQGGSTGSARPSALICASSDDAHAPVVRLLLEGGADPSIASFGSWTPLMDAASEGRLEIVRSLLVKATINRRYNHGETALSRACFMGYEGVVRALLEGGADPTIANNSGITPMAIAKRTRSRPYGVTAEARRECVAALQVAGETLILFYTSAVF